MELASESYEEAGDSYLKAGNFKFACDLWMHAAQAASEFGNHERAKSLAIKAIDLRREKLLIKRLPNDFLKMADILTNANHLKMAIQYLDESLTLAEHLKKWDLAQRVRYQLGQTNLQAGEVSTALYHFEAASHEMESRTQTQYAINAIKECRKIYISQDRDFDAYQMDQLLNCFE
jgi:tetratricopeptide (TPR) repeat protein